MNPAPLPFGGERSPDGKWIAYSDPDAEGFEDIYVLAVIIWLAMQKVGDADERMADRPASVGPAFDSSGVDRTLIRWMLSLSPAERLQVLENHIGSIQQLRRGRKDS